MLLADKCSIADKCTIADKCANTDGYAIADGYGKVARDAETAKHQAIQVEQQGEAAPLERYRPSSMAYRCSTWPARWTRSSDSRIRRYQGVDVSDGAVKAIRRTKVHNRHGAWSISWSGTLGPSIGAAGAK